MRNNANYRSAAAAGILAALIGFGAATVWTFLLIWGQFFYAAFFTAAESRTELCFTVDGEALAVTFEPSMLPITVAYRAPNGDLRSETTHQRPYFRTLDGKPVEHPMALQESWRMSNNVMPGPGERSHYGSQRGNIVSYLGAQPPTYWYLIYHEKPQGHAYFMGFDPQSKLRVGYLSTRGFSAEPPPLADQFAIPENLWGRGSREPSPGQFGREPSGDFDDSQYLVSGEHVYLVDFANRTATRVDLPDGVVSLGSTWKPHVSEDGSKIDDERQTLIRLAKEIRYLDGRSIPIPEAIRDQNILVISTIGDEVILSARYFAPSQEELYWIDSEGKVTRHAQAPQEPERGTGGMEWVSTLAMPMPLVLGIMLFVVAPLSTLSRGAADDFPTALAKTLPDVWLPFLIVCLVSVVLAAACYRRHRRFSDRGAAGWAIFVLLLGVPGWIGYRLHRRWPARVRCAGCGAIVPRDRETCLACLAEFPPPSQLGIEVFA